jgi:hypothetical protein
MAFPGVSPWDILAQAQGSTQAWQPPAQQQVQQSQAATPLWQQFKTDPMMQMAMLQAGASMLQPRMPGQSSAGQVAQGITTGFGSLTQQRAAQGEAEREERKMRLEERKETNVERGMDREWRLKQAEVRQRLREWDELEPMRSVELDYKRAQARALDREGTGETERMSQRLAKLFYGSGEFETPAQAELAAIDYLMTVKQTATPEDFAVRFWSTVGPMLPFMPDALEEMMDIYRNLSIGLAQGGVFQSKIPIGERGEATSADPLEGRTATNPATGEQLIRRGGEWVPLKEGR